MKELLDKISSYNLFNYLLPGVLFAVLVDSITSYSFVQGEIILGVFVYYFLGLVISRVGSLVIEPTLKKLSFIKFAPYEDFVYISKKDPKLEVLSEVNNMYRTFCSLFMLLGFLKIYEVLSEYLGIRSSLSVYFLVAVFFVLFAFAYKKQTQYIARRIESEKK